MTLRIKLIVDLLTNEFWKAGEQDADGSQGLRTFQNIFQSDDTERHEGRVNGL